MTSRGIFLGSALFVAGLLFAMSNSMPWAEIIAACIFGALLAIVMFVFALTLELSVRFEEKSKGLRKSFFDARPRV